MIIIGYPGIGKSTIASKDHRFIDLESSYFRNDPNWPTQYVKFAEKLSDDGFNVFVSSHEEVVNKLKAFHIYRKHKILNVIPSLDIRDEWVRMLETRANRTPRMTSERSKNDRAYERANTYFNSDVELLLLDGFDSLILDSLDGRNNLAEDILSFEGGCEMAADFMSFERLLELHSKLVKRHRLQTDILQLKAAGETNRYIAGKLGIPESTVMAFLKNLEEEDEKFI